MRMGQSKLIVCEEGLDGSRETRKNELELKEFCNYSTAVIYGTRIITNIWKKVED